MPVLIDAYNALQATGVLPPELAGPDLDQLADYITRSRWKRHQTTLVCDGQKRGEPRERQAGHEPASRVRTLYAGPGRDADSLLERLIQESSAPRRLVVVSSDRRIQIAARRRKAKAMTSEAFLETLVADLSAKRAPPHGQGSRPPFARDLPLASDAAAAWIDDLGLTGDPLLALAPSAPPRSTRNAKAPSDTAHPGASGCKSTRPQTNQDGAPIDPLLLEALEEWSDRLCVDDLDMDQWLMRSDMPGPDD